MYCVVVGDIVNSRKLDAESREKVTRAAKDIFDRINTEYIGALMTNFGMVRGDAFEGVLLTQSYAPKIVHDIIKAIYLAERATVRVSVVMGELTVTGNDRNDTDGPAFYQALDELSQMKKRKSTHWLQISFKTGSSAQAIIDSQLKLLAALTEGWTDKQREIVWAMEACGGQQKVVGRQLDLKPSVVSKQLKAAHYYIYHEAWEALTEYLVSLDEYMLEKKSAAGKSYVPYFNIALRKYKQGYIDEGLSLLQKALVLAKKNLNPNDPLLIMIYNTLAEVSAEARRYDEASKMIKESMRLQETMPKARMQYADTLLKQALICRKKGELEEAKAFAEEASSAVGGVLDDGHPYFNLLDHNLAEIYMQMNEPEKACLFFERELSRTKEKAEQDPCRYAVALHDMAFFYHNERNDDKALPYAEDALRIFEEIFPPSSDHIKELRKLLTDINSSLGGL